MHADRKQLVGAGTGGRGKWGCLMGREFPLEMMMLWRWTVVLICPTV